MAKVTIPKPQELAKVNYRPPAKGWMDVKPEFRPGTYVNAAQPKWLEMINYPYPRAWAVNDEDWKLPDNWKQIILEGMEDRLKQYRSFKLFMDTCVRCGACADKCHFFIGGGDPKNMPVLRAELLRSVYRKDFTALGKVLGKLAGARELTDDVRQGVVLLLLPVYRVPPLLGLLPLRHRHGRDHHDGPGVAGAAGHHINWAIEPVANCYRYGNHLAHPPHGIQGYAGFHGRRNRGGSPASESRCPDQARAPRSSSSRPRATTSPTPGIYTCMGYMLLFHELGLDYTFSTYASEGGNFGLFTSHEMIKRLNSKIYAEAKRLGVKWILGGECGHMWRVLHQYMDTVNGPARLPGSAQVPLHRHGLRERQGPPRWFTSWSSSPT